jgi:hypothetical protein
MTSNLPIAATRVLATRPGPEDTLRAVAFALLLAERTPVSGADIASAAGVDDVGGALDALAGAGWLDRDTEGRVTGAAGLSLDHGEHVLMIAGHRFRTWCAYDALGIAGALGADASIETSCGQCNVLIEVPVLAGRPPASRPARLWLSAGGTDLRTDFCTPTVLLCSMAHAELWATEQHHQGAILRLRPAASRGAGEWAECARTAVALGAWVGPVR